MDHGILKAQENLLILAANKFLVINFTRFKLWLVIYKYPRVFYSKTNFCSIFIKAYLS